MRRVALIAALVISAQWVSACRSQSQLQPLFDTATAALWRGEMSKARGLAEQGVHQSGQPDSVWGWKFRLLRAEIALVGGERVDVASTVAADVPRAAEYSWIRAKQKYLEAQLKVVQGRAADALPILDEANRLADVASASDIALDTQALRGQVLSRLRRWSDADATLNALAERAKQGRDRYREAVALLNLGMNRLVRNRFDEAMLFFDRVVSFSDLSSQLVYAGALINAGISHARLGEFDQALDLLQRAVRSHEERGSRVYLQQALGEMGNTYLLAGRLPEGIATLKKALDVAKESHLDSDTAIWVASLASAHIAMQQWDQADAFNAEAGRLRGDPRNRPYQVVNDARIAEGRGDIMAARRIYTDALRIGRDEPSVAWQAYAGLGRLDIAASQWQEGLRNYEAALQILERRRVDLARPEYRLSIQSRQSDMYREYVDVLAGRGQFDEALAIADSSRARVLAERQGMASPGRPLSAVFRQSVAQLRSVALFYWIGPVKSYAWVVTKDRVRFVPLAIDAAETTRLVREYQRFIVDALIDPVANTTTPGDPLYDKLIAPVAMLIPMGARVVIVPDGALNTLNFETLPVPGQKRHYLVEDVEIAIAPSLGTLSEDVRLDRPAHAGSVLLVGDAVSVDPAFPQLRYAAAEMNTVSKSFDARASVLRADQASPRRYVEAMPDRFDVVHFTAHAAANAESPLDSAVILSKDSSGYKLYARDVAEQKLSADLVTISACRSAGERTYAGEGLVGFAWAFLRAGAQRVIAGLWDVDDRSTADLMGRVYAQIAEGRSPGAALRAAKLEMIARGGPAAKPYYWGPFELFVGSRVVP
jgi:CHAT domain-containing protein